MPLQDDIIKCSATNTLHHSSNDHPKYPKYHLAPGGAMNWLSDKWNHGYHSEKATQKSLAPILPAFI